MTNSKAIDLARARARKRIANRAGHVGQLFANADRWNRAIDEIGEGETIDERRERLTKIHWHLFGEAPPFNRSAPRPSPSPGAWV